MEKDGQSVPDQNFETSKSPYEAIALSALASLIGMLLVAVSRSIFFTPYTKRGPRTLGSH